VVQLVGGDPAGLTEAPEPEAGAGETGYVRMARKVAVNTSLLVGGRFLTASSGLIGTAVATRYLGPSSFGQLAAGLAFVSMVVIVADVGLFTVAARELARTSGDTRRLIAGVLGLGLAASTVAVAVCVGGMFLLYPGSDQSLTRRAIAILLVQLAVNAPAGTAIAWFNARQRAGPLTFASAVASLGFLVALVLSITLDGGFSAVAAAYALSAVLTGLLPLLFARGDIPLRIAYDRDVWRRILRAALPQGAVLIVGTVYFRLDLTLVSVISSHRQTALYGVAYKVIEALLWLPGMLMFALFPEMARVERGTERLRELAQTAFTSLELVALPLLVLFIGFAPDVIAVVGGNEFAPAAGVLRLLVVAMVLGYFNLAFGWTMSALGQQTRLLRVLVITLVVNVGLNAVLIPADGARGAAIALIASEVVSIAYALRVYRALGAQPRLYEPAKLAVATAAMAAVPLLRLLFPASHSLLGGLGAVAAGVIVAGGIYLGALRLLGAVPENVAAVLAPLTARLRAPRA
jgi:O-antigen/teichoic acid export membrane protein